MPKTQNLLSTGDVARRAGVTRTTVLHWITAGKLRPALTTPGGHYRVSEADLEGFLATHRGSAAQLSHRSESILVVDDDPSVRDVIARLLRPAFPDFKIDTASDGVDAGIKLLRQRPRLLILDLLLPGIDGFEVCRRVRSDPELRGTAILCITGHVHPGVYESAIEAGADECLFKPLEIDILRAQVQRLLEESH